MTSRAGALAGLILRAADALEDGDKVRVSGDDLRDAAVLLGSCEALAHRVEQLEAALRDALPALEYVTETANVEMDDTPCEELCGYHQCEACGCLAGKIAAARAALSGVSP